MFIGLLFLFIETKELCEARAKLETSSNFQIYSQGVNLTDPPFKTARALSKLFTVQCRQWEPIQNGQLIGIYKEIPVQIYKDTDTKDRYKEKAIPPRQMCQARE